MRRPVSFSLCFLFLETKIPRVHYSQTSFYFVSSLKNYNLSHNPYRNDSFLKPTTFGTLHRTLFFQDQFPFLSTFSELHIVRTDTRSSSSYGRCRPPSPTPTLTSSTPTLRPVFLVLELPKTRCNCLKKRKSFRTVPDEMLDLRCQNVNLSVDLSHGVRVD